MIEEGRGEMTHTKGPWHWTNGEYECGKYCSPNGCGGHDNGIPYELEPVGLFFDILEYSPADEDIQRWIADARLMKTAPDLLAALEPLAERYQEIAERGDKPLETMVSFEWLHNAAITFARAKGES